MMFSRIHSGDRLYMFNHVENLLALKKEKKKTKYPIFELGMVVHAWNSRTLEVEWDKAFMSLNPAWTT